MKPQIELVQFIIAPGWATIATRYRSGRVIQRHISTEPEQFMLYPMEFLRRTRRIRHIVYQLALYGCIPKSIKDWMRAEHPKATWKDNELDSDIFTFRLEGNSDCSILGFEEFNY